ncbi:ribosome assembly RNA-binding protein YhbY [Pandoraea terrigena]|uniref:RNA-binding protein n=1 Tax=Pandoraea terrigena TaxID=2508292 RepID=A0A5E4V2X5_9BURK|nr:ribosome assembly RNA-binding protein YhbY [Pandoraea terrigena]VVE06471.1 RNA-binding protein [Pandoraea terrigena]
MPALTLTPAQRADLRSAAHALNPVVLIGADGLTPAVLKEIDGALKAHELIKVRVFGDERDARVAIYDAICDQLGAAPVQHIGKLLVLYRPTPDETQAPVRGRTGGTGATVKGRAPRTVTVVKTSTNAGRRPTVKKVTVRGNERMTAGGIVKKAKKRQTSVKRQRND